MSRHHALVEVRTSVTLFIVLYIPCPSCQAKVGEPCRNGDGELLQIEELPVFVHVSRLAPLWVVYRIGYQHGRRNQKLGDQP